MKKVLVVLGATGIGKTEISIKLAKEFNMEIISADSVQVFKEFNIGSAKIDEREKENIAHYGIDIKEPYEEFSASDFVNYALSKIEQIIKKGKVPLIVGGTGLYVKALINGYNFGGTEKHKEFREALQELALKEGNEALLNKLKEISPSLAENIDIHNTTRLIRAIEIATFGNEKTTKANNIYDFKIIALSMPREQLYQRINIRSQKMIEKGLIDEVKKLYEKYGNCQAMRAIGYKEVVDFLEDKITKPQMIDLISQHTRNYAKRQITFIKGIDNVKYFDVSKDDFLVEIEEDLKKWLSLQ